MSAPQTTRAYDRRPDANLRSKIQDPERGEGAFWHRMGDVGYLDDQGRFWYCGRKSHRVVTHTGTLFSVQCEAIFNTHPLVHRSALVGVGERGAQRPVIVIEPHADAWPRDAREREAFAAEMVALARIHAHTSSITEVVFHHDLPVDRRHNSKIHREELAQWAAGALARGRRSTPGPRPTSLPAALSPRRAAAGDRVAQVALVAAGALAIGVLVGVARRRRR